MVVYFLRAFGVVPCECVFNFYHEITIRRHKVMAVMQNIVFVTINSNYFCTKTSEAHFFKFTIHYLPSHPITLFGNGDFDGVLWIFGDDIWERNVTNRKSLTCTFKRIMVISERLQTQEEQELSRKIVCLLHGHVPVNHT